MGEREVVNKAKMELFTAAGKTEVLGTDGNIYDRSLDSSASIVIAAYLIENLSEFRELAELRKMGSALHRQQHFCFSQTFLRLVIGLE